MVELTDTGAAYLTERLDVGETRKKTRHAEGGGTRRRGEGPGE